MNSELHATYGMHTPGVIEFSVTGSRGDTQHQEGQAIQYKGLIGRYEGDLQYHVNTASEGMDIDANGLYAVLWRDDVKTADEGAIDQFSCVVHFAGKHSPSMKDLKVSVVDEEHGIYAVQLNVAGTHRAADKGTFGWIKLPEAIVREVVSMSGSCVIEVAWPSQDEPTCLMIDERVLGHIDGRQPRKLH